MPELPEVESTARFLRERVVGSTIAAVDVRWRRTVATHPSAEFARLLNGRAIVQVGRRGKFIRLVLAPGPELLYAHMRMSGSFDVLSAQAPQDPHDRLVLRLSSGQEVRFCDPRKFGRFYLVTDPHAIEGALGIEPLEEQFTVEALAAILKDQRARIKPFLLRQDRIAGLGNIYVDEALWFARVHPLRSAASLTAAEIALLHRGIREILAEAITHAGTDFGDGVVYGGGYIPKVYGRDGKPCLRCTRTIRRLLVGQRGTHVCTKCQRAPRGRQ